MTKKTLSKILEGYLDDYMTPDSQKFIQSHTVAKLKGDKATGTSDDDLFAGKNIKPTKLGGPKKEHGYKNPEDEKAYDPHVTDTKPVKEEKHHKKDCECEKCENDRDEMKEETHSPEDLHFKKQSKKMQDAINLHLRNGKNYTDAVKAAKMHVKEDVDQIGEGVGVRNQIRKAILVGAKSAKTDKEHEINKNIITKLTGKKEAGKTYDTAKKMVAKEEVEELDELSDRIKSAYMGSSVGDLVARSQEHGYNVAKKEKNLGDNARKIRNRQDGIYRATKGMRREEVEELDEVTASIDHTYVSNKWGQASGKVQAIFNSLEKAKIPHSVSHMGDNHTYITSDHPKFASHMEGLAKKADTYDPKIYVHGVKEEVELDEAMAILPKAPSNVKGVLALGDKVREKRAKAHDRESEKHRRIYDKHYDRGNEGTRAAQKALDTSIHHDEMAERYRDPENHFENRRRRKEESRDISFHEEAEIAEKTLTPAEIKKRNEIADAIKRRNPNMPDDQKMAIATAAAKRVTEQKEIQEAGMPSSVIKHKQQLANMTDKEFAEKHGDKPKEKLRSLAWSHGYGKPGTPGHDHYVNRVAAGLKESVELDEAKRGRPSKTNPEQNIEPIQTQLQKMHKQNEVDVTFADKSQHTIPREHANKALKHLSSLKPIHREAAQKQMSSSKQGFYDTLAGKKPEAQPKITLAKLRTMKESSQTIVKLGTMGVKKKAVAPSDEAREKKPGGGDD